MPTQERLKELFDYDALTGVLIYRTARGPCAAGKRAEYFYRNVHGHKRRSVGIDGRYHHCSRVIWVWHFGALTAGQQVDHINHDTMDDHIENLRSVPNVQNCRNKSISKRNRSGVTGVYYCENTKARPWRATIGLNFKKVYLGDFPTKQEAVTARYNAEIKYGYHANHGRNVTLQ